MLSPAMLGLNEGINVFEVEHVTSKDRLSDLKPEFTVEEKVRIMRISHADYFISARYLPFFAEDKERSPFSSVVKGIHFSSDNALFYLQSNRPGSDYLNKRMGDNEYPYRVREHTTARAANMFQEIVTDPSKINVLIAIKDLFPDIYYDMNFQAELNMIRARLSRMEKGMDKQNAQDLSNVDTYVDLLAAYRLLAPDDFSLAYQDKERERYVLMALILLERKRSNCSGAVEAAKTLRLAANLNIVLADDVVYTDRGIRLKWERDAQELKEEPVPLPQIRRF